MVFACAGLAWGGYTTQVLVAGDGWYLSDAMAGPMGYGVFGVSTAHIEVDGSIPSGLYDLYFMPDFELTFRPLRQYGGEPHFVAMGSDGVELDGTIVPWGDLGWEWEPGAGIALGTACMVPPDSGSLLGTHDWDLDGGGSDVSLFVKVDPYATSGRAAYATELTLMRSLTWLSGQPIGSLFVSGLSLFIGGLPLDGLEECLNDLAPAVGEWDRYGYNVRYGGSVTVTGRELPVPEASSLLLLGGGLGLLLTVRRKSL